MSGNKSKNRPLQPDENNTSLFNLEEIKGVKDYSSVKLFSEYSQGPPLYRAEEEGLIKRIKEGDEEAKNTLIERSYPLIIKIARKYIGRGVAFEDLVQEGSIGVLKAIEKYDEKHESKSRFSTYATWWVKKQMIDAINNYSKTIRIPSYVYNLYNSIGKATNKLAQTLNREPTNEEIAEYLNIPLTKVESVFAAILPVVSLEDDSFINPELHETKISLSPYNIPDETQALQKEDEAENNVMLEQYRQHLRRILNDRELLVIIYRKGLFGCEEKTFSEIGDIIGITREGVRQIEIEVERKLREDAKFVEFKNDFLLA